MSRCENVEAKESGCLCTLVRACMRVRVRACVCARAQACAAYVSVCVRARVLGGNGGLRLVHGIQHDPSTCVCLQWL